MHMSPDEFRRAGRLVVDWIARYMEEVERYPVPEAETTDGLDLVMFWKQGDVGLYGRRFDMLVEALALRDDIRRIAVFDAPFTVHQVLRDHASDVTVRLAYLDADLGEEPRTLAPIGGGLFHDTSVWLRPA